MNVLLLNRGCLRRGRSCAAVAGLGLIAGSALVAGCQLGIEPAGQPLDLSGPGYRAHPIPRTLNADLQDGATAPDRVFAQAPTSWEGRLVNVQEIAGPGETPIVLMQLEQPNRQVLDVVLGSPQELRGLNWRPGERVTVWGSPATMAGQEVLVARRLAYQQQLIYLQPGEIDLNENVYQDHVFGIERYYDPQPEAFVSDPENYQAQQRMAAERQQRIMRTRPGRLGAEDEIGEASVEPPATDRVRIDDARDGEFRFGSGSSGAGTGGDSDEERVRTRADDPEDIDAATQQEREQFAPSAPLDVEGQRQQQRLEEGQFGPATDGVIEGTSGEAGGDAAEGGGAAGSGGTSGGASGAASGGTSGGTSGGGGE